MSLNVTRMKIVDCCRPTCRDHASFRLQCIGHKGTGYCIRPNRN